MVNHTDTVYLPLGPKCFYAMRRASIMHGMGLQAAANYMYAASMSGSENSIAWHQSKLLEATVSDLPLAEPACDPEKDTIVNSSSVTARNFFKWVNYRGAYLDYEALCCYDRSPLLGAACDSGDLITSPFDVMYDLLHRNKYDEGDHLNDGESVLVRGQLLLDIAKAFKDTRLGLFLEYVQRGLLSRHNMHAILASDVESLSFVIDASGFNEFKWDIDVLKEMDESEYFEEVNFGDVEIEIVEPKLGQR